MDEIFGINSYQVKESKSGHPIVVINNIHLHSAYDPIKEAQNFLEQHKKLLETNQNILILGLGLGHHIHQIISYCEQHQIEDFEIFVIEPFHRTVLECNQHNPIKHKNVTVFQNDSVDELYKKRDIINFLQERPGVIIHRPSYNVFNNFFKDFLTYENKNDIASVVHFIDSNEFKDYLLQYDENQKIQDIIDSIVDKKYLESEWEYFLLAFHQIN